MRDAGAEFDSLFASVEADEIAYAARPTLFRTDCLWIAEQAQKSPDALPGIASLVLLSIRQPFVYMPRQIEDVAEWSYSSPYMFGWKKHGLLYVRENKRDLHRSAVACADGRKSLDDLILDYLAIPGLGIVKASFLAQMTVGDGACLDTLNLRTLGLSETAFRMSKTLTVKTVRRRIAAYNACWRSVGDSAYWWDSWCEIVASRSHNVLGRSLQGFDSAAAVSAQHRLAITGGIR